MPLSKSADATASNFKLLQMAVASCSLGIVLLLLAMFWPMPLVIVFAMSGGAAMVLASLGLLALVVFRDLRGHQVF
jgi:ABC-type nickel/cobalt efflux system permease component RcnA